MSNAGRTMPLPNPPLVLQNTSPDHHPGIVWGGLPHDGCLVLSDSPEALDDSVLSGAAGTLYQDLSASSQGGATPSSHFISGDLRVFAFHTNRSGRTLDIGFTVRNASGRPGTLTWYRKGGQGQDTNAVRLAQSIAYGWFSDRDRWRVDKRRPLGPDATASFWVEAVPPPIAGRAATAILWYALRLEDAKGAPLGIDVQVWVREHGTTPDPWDAPPLAPTGAIRATLPHAAGLVRFPYDARANGNIFIDLDGQGASEAPGLPAGPCNTSPYGWPNNVPKNCLRRPPPYLASDVAALAPGASTVDIGGVPYWAYSGDPLGFDQAGPAAEYMAGWDWLDQSLDGQPDPATAGLWYPCAYWKKNLRRWNYGEYGTEIHLELFDPDGSRPFQVGLSAGYRPHSIPWAFYDKTHDRAAEVPWALVSEGAFNPTNQYVIADRVHRFEFATTLTGGAYGPVRIVLQGAS